VSLKAWGRHSQKKPLACRVSAGHPAPCLLCHCFCPYPVPTLCVLTPRTAVEKTKPEKLSVHSLVTVTVTDQAILLLALGLYLASHC
jgi:hypothetical protein